MHITRQGFAKRPSSSRRTRAAIAVAAVAAAAVTLSACSGSSPTPAASNATFVAATQSLPATLDPQQISGNTPFYFAAMNSLLVNYGDTGCSAAPDSTKLVGQLAKSWKTSADGKTITVTLNDDKSEYGNPLTSADVKYTLERGRATSPVVKFLSSNSVHLDPTNPITIVDEHTFTFNLTSPSPLDLAMWGVPTFTILDSVEMKKHATTDDPWSAKWLATHSALFGPWKTDSFTAGDSVTLSANPGFVGSRGNVGKLVVKQVTESANQMQLLQSGSLNYAKEMTYQQFASLKGATNVKVNSCAPISRDQMLLNQKTVKQFADVRVRQAISMALDRDALNQGAFAGLGTPAVHGLLTGVLPDSSDLTKIPTGDVDGAKKLLAEAGYPDGFSFTLAYNPTQPGAEVDQLSVLIQSQLKKIGITVELNPIASGTDASNDWQSGNYQALLWSSGAALPSAYFEATLIEPGAPANSYGYTSDEFVSLTNQLAASTAGSDEYKKISVEIANLVVQDVPLVSLVDTPNIFATSSSVSGIDDALGTIMKSLNFSKVTVK